MQNYRGNIFTTAGHHLKDPGAVSPDGIHVERDLTIRARDSFIYFLKKKHPLLKVWKDNDEDTLTQVISLLMSKIGSNDLILDWHYNSASPTATGVECVVNNNAGKFSIEVAEIICKTISEIYEIPNRGVKRERDTPRKSLAITKLKGSAVVVEIGFISNKSDMSKDEKLLHWAMEDCAVKVGDKMKEGVK